MQTDFMEDWQGWLIWASSKGSNKVRRPMYHFPSIVGALLIFVAFTFNIAYTVWSFPVPHPETLHVQPTRLVSSKENWFLYPTIAQTKN